MGGRYQRNRERGIIDRRVDYSGDDPKEADDLAEAAEHLVAIRYGQDHQVQTKEPDAGCDLVGSGHCLQIKSTKYVTGDLMKVNDGKLHFCEFFVLVTGKMGRQNIVGWTHGERLERCWTTHNSKGSPWKKPCWSMPQSDIELGIDQVDAMVLEYFGWKAVVAPALICYACGQRHEKEFLCRPMTDALWTIVKGGNREQKAWRWARARLGLDEHRV